MASPATGAAEPLDAVVLAGGRSTRLGGQDKATLRLDGARLVDRTVAAVQRAGATRVVVVGPDALDPGVPVVQERPPFGGPVAGLAAGLTGLTGLGGERATAVLVLACDLAGPTEALSALLAAWHACEDDALDALDALQGVHLVDESGHPQWLTGIYRRAALEQALSAIGEPSGQSVRRLLAGLPLRGVRVAPAVTADIDTWEDLSIARQRRVPRRPDE